MPRGKRSESPSLSPGQAAYVLERLLAERRVSRAEVGRYVSEMGREISELEQRLQRLREAHGIGAIVGGVRRAAGAVAGRARRGRPPRAASAETAKVPVGRRKRRRRAITPEQLASRQLQGKYLSLVRRFPATRRAQFAKVAKDRGREAAIRDMQQALNK